MLSLAFASRSYAKYYIYGIDSASVVFLFSDRCKYKMAAADKADNTVYCRIFCGVLVPIIYISIRYGFATYPEMVQGLFAMTDTATDYKPDSMVTAMFADYIENSVWLFLFLAYMAAGFAAFALLTKDI